MDHHLLNIAARRGRGPTGISAGLKQGISWNDTFNWLPNDLGEKLVAQIFFLVDEHMLDGRDEKILEAVAKDLQNMVAEGHKVTIDCRGRADVSYKEDHNLKLARRRAKSVADFIKLKMGYASFVEPAKLTYTATGEANSRTKKSFWLEDRRVDVVARVTPEYTYKYQYWCDNKDVLRPHIFKTYYPRYWLWRSRRLGYLVDQYENENQPGGSGWVKIKPADYDRVLEIIEMLADHSDWENKIKVWVATRDRERVITTAYEVEYRKAYQVAYKRAYQDFQRSDYRSSCEFFAKKFGLVPENTPYERRPGRGKSDKKEEEYEYKGSTTHGKP